MAKSSSKDKNLKRRPPMSPEEQEKRLITLAYEQAERQLIDGTAPPSVVSYFLKLGASREMLEELHLKKKVEYLDAKIEEAKAVERTEVLYREAVEAMKRYQGVHDDSDIFGDD